MQPANRKNEIRESRRVTILGGVFDALLGVSKVIVGYIAHSHALVVDGIHSFTDVATDVVVVLVMWFSREEPDSEHPYGHERFETLGTVFMGAMLIMIAGALAYDNALRLIDFEAPVIPTWPALATAAASIIIKEGIYHWSLRVGRRIGSQLLIANAWHSRSDALSSVVVFVGVVGTMAGLVWLDLIAALLVAVLIARIGWNLMWKSIKELVDTAIPPKKSHAMRETILKVPGVRGVHDFRSRRMGEQILLDAHIQVAPEISVSEGHRIGEDVTRVLLESFPNIRDVTVHVDAEEDEREDTAVHLEESAGPLRPEAEAILRNRWQDLPYASRIERITLHYLDGGVSAEVFLPLALVSEPDFSSEDFSRRIEEASTEVEWLKHIRVWYGQNNVSR